MERMIDRQHPCFLGPLRFQSDIISIDISRGLSGLQKGSLESLENRNLVVRSLRDYAATINSGSLNHVIGEMFIKPGKTIPPGEFLIRALPRHGRNLEKPRKRGYFFVDGEYGIALGFKKGDERKPLWLACTSFSPYPDSKEAPLIKQIQARTFNRGVPNEPLREEINRILQCIRWERLLVSLVSGWAQGCSLPGVAVISSENLLPLLSHVQQRTKMRYDVTARRMGLKQQQDKNYLFRFERPSFP